MDRPASAAVMSSFLRYQPTPELGSRPIPPEGPIVRNGPAIAQSCGRFTRCHARSSKSGCTKVTELPQFPAGRPNLRAGSLMNALPVGRIQALITVDDAMLSRPAAVG